MRNADKWLTPESLRSGVSETNAFQRGGVQHTVLLAHAPEHASRQWVVRHAATQDGNLLFEHRWWFDSLNDARARWRKEVRRGKQGDLT